MFKGSVVENAAGLSCAIHMKEYTIMLYLMNQMSWSNNKPL